MLYQVISNDMKEAMKNHDKETLGTIRMLKSAIDLDRINNKLEEITDDLVIGVVSKQIKTLEATIIEFEKGNRNDLIEKTQNEIAILEKYLPEQLSEDEVKKIIEEIFEEVKPQGQKDMGKVMKEATGKLKGKTDMKSVSEIIKNKLS